MRYALSIPIWGYLAWLFGGWFTVVAVAAVVAGLMWWAFVPRFKVPRWRVKYQNTRLRLMLHPGRGFASAFELWLRWGRLASFRESGRTRPALSCLYRMLNPGQHSIRLGLAHYFLRARVQVQENVLIMSSPRSGKTGLLARIMLKYPGPVVNTTTKADVYRLTSGVRSQIGPVHVFNPQGIGGVPSTFRWNPIHGCEDPAVAIRRADAFANAVSTDGTEEASFWSSKASAYLRAMFHAAALIDGDMRLVTRWALASAEQAEEILARAGAGQWALELSELRGAAQKTAQTIRMVISRALACMTDPALAASVLPEDGSSGFDIAEFLAWSGSLYMIASHPSEESPLAPLFAAMASEIHYVATLIGQSSPGGRLDPPLGMFLDEVTQICPIPLPAWNADSGGKGIQIIAVAHGEAQLAQRWGPYGKRIILDTAGVKILLPGVTDTETLDSYSRLCGQVTYWERKFQQYIEPATADMMTPAMIRQLPRARALVIRAGCSPVIVRLGMAWKDRAYKTARRRGRVAAAIASAPPHASFADLKTLAVLDGRPPSRPADAGFADFEADDDDGSSYPWSN